MEIKEFEIPVPWGHIAVKIWGDERDEPVFVFHGLLDNAGSFDALIPLLPRSFYYICVDLPSHGKSTHFPAYLPLHAEDYIIPYKILVDYFKRMKYIFMGHSFGAQIAVLYAQLYPEHVTKLILLDSIYFFPTPIPHFKYTLTDKLENVMDFMEKSKKKGPPTYTFEEAVSRVINGRGVAGLTTEAAEALVKRSMIPASYGKYTFSWDQRLKWWMRPNLSRAYVVELLKKHPVQCPTLIIMASESVTRFTYMQPIMKQFQRNKLTIVKKVEGTHDVHMVKPEVVAPTISKFLTYKKTKL